MDHLEEQRLIGLKERVSEWSKRQAGTYYNGWNTDMSRLTAVIINGDDPGEWRAKRESRGHKVKLTETQISLCVREAARVQKMQAACGVMSAQCEHALASSDENAPAEPRSGPIVDSAPDDDPPPDDEPNGLPPDGPEPDEGFEDEAPDEKSPDDLHDAAPDIYEPLDIFGDAFPEPQLTPAMLPKVIADYAWDEAARIGVDPACIAIPAIGVCAAGLDDAIRIQPMRHDTRWTERACLWLGFIAPPSARKTPALESARKPAKELEKIWRQEDAQEMARYIDAREAWKATKARGEDAGEEPRKPSMRRLSTSDYTMESLADILVENERGILVFNDELIGFITGLDAYKATKGKDRSAALELFNGSDRAVDRKNNYLYVPNWSACVIGGIQDDRLRQIAPNLAVDGMLQRFLLWRSTKLLPGEDRAPNIDALETYWRTYRTLVGQSSDVTIKLADEAHKWREEVFKIADAYAIDDSLPAAFRTHVGKLRGIFARLVLALHAIECSARQEPLSREVPEQTARMARDLIIEFFIPHELAAYVDLFGNGQLGADMQWVAGWLLTHSRGSFSERDVYRVNRDFMKDRRRLNLALRGLFDMGWISGSSPVWEVNPKIHVLYAKRANAEKAERDKRKAAIAENAKHYRRAA